MYTFCFPLPLLPSLFLSLSLFPSLFLSPLYLPLPPSLFLSLPLPSSLFSLPLQIAFAAADSVTGLKLIEAGLPKEKIAMMALPMVPLQIILPWIIRSVEWRDFQAGF